MTNQGPLESPERLLVGLLRDLVEYEAEREAYWGNPERWRSKQEKRWERQERRRRQAEMETRYRPSKAEQRRLQAELETMRAKVRCLLHPRVPEDWDHYDYIEHERFTTWLIERWCDRQDELAVKAAIEEIVAKLLEQQG